MRGFFVIFYWAVMVFVVSLILWSVMQSYGTALFLSVMLLPGVLFVKFFAKDISFKDRKTGVLHTIYFIAVAMLIEYLAIIFVYWNIYEYPLHTQMPRIVMNPLFLWFLLSALLAFEWLLKKKLFSGEPPAEKYIMFISDRKKVSLEIDTIMYIESRDYEVEVMTCPGVAYPTRMKISQWESVLDDRFLRIHRSFIVNRNHITKFDSKVVWLGETAIDISRKYRESVAAKLGKTSLP